MPHQIFSVTVDSIRGCELAQVITGNRPLTVIGGNNAQGKSSFLDAVAMTLGGKKLFPKNPIYNDRNEAYVSVRLEGESTYLPWPCTVTRTLMKEDDGQITTRVKIEADDGSIAPSPQTILNDVLGCGLSFDPLEFVREKPAKQVDIVKGLVGLDFTALDAEWQKAYDNRTHVNRVAKQLDGKLKQTPIHNDVPSEKVDVAALVEELKDADAHNNQIHQDTSRLAECQQKLDQLDIRVDAAQRRTQEKLEALKQQYEAAVLQTKESLAEFENEATNDRTKLQAEIQALEEIDEEPIDTAPIQDKIARAGDINKKMDENEARLEIYAEKRRATEESKKLSKRLKEIEEEKARLADEAKWPIQGMGFGQDGLTMDGKPFQDLSSKEQLNCSVAIAMKLNPVFPFCMIRHGSLLDEQGMIELEAIVANHHGQVFIERVGEGEECHVILEQGRMKKRDK